MSNIIIAILSFALGYCLGDGHKLLIYVGTNPERFNRSIFGVFVGPDGETAGIRMFCIGREKEEK